MSENGIFLINGACLTRDNLFMIDLSGLTWRIPQRDKLLIVNVCQIFENQVYL